MTVHALGAVDRCDRSGELLDDAVLREWLTQCAVAHEGEIPFDVARFLSRPRCARGGAAVVGLDGDDRAGGEPEPLLGGERNVSAETSDSEAGTNATMGASDVPSETFARSSSIHPVSTSTTCAYARVGESSTLTSWLPNVHSA